MFWEQKSWHLKLKDSGFTPVDLCEQLGVEGRNALLEVLCINYRDEVEGQRWVLEKMYPGHKP